ncbi:hypothetical protein Poli38472_008410 [Pythium oligandrum]|uniref:Uncharacterized protein n=1 Tax=Pythium oligandrum TaxID=41045 RepID=A0A8K1CP05_PYTOL|nr:hypothetical protein Poli38472_008410 [Pythium oligandrum]|eukprot:TMW65768.1 hypothetical protein Poli38472_008410 [Pythium oligandrum]
MTTKNTADMARATANTAECDLMALLFPLVVASQLSNADLEKVTAVVRTLSDTLAATAKHVDQLKIWLHEAEAAEHTARQHLSRLEGEADDQEAVIRRLNEHISKCHAVVARLEDEAKRRERVIHWLEVDICMRDESLRWLDDHASRLYTFGRDMTEAKDVMEQDLETQCGCVDRLVEDVAQRDQEIEDLKKQVEMLTAALAEASSMPRSEETAPPPPKATRDSEDPLN